MGDAAIPQSTNVLELCKSPFEREVGARLLKLGYQLRPQVAVGGYRIDFVVEGMGDRRLAIELDGNSYHGPDKWVADLYRQRALERMGWKFWRCWGSHWRANSNGCLDDLQAKLAQMVSIRLEVSFRRSSYTEHRVVDTADAAVPTEQDMSGPQTGRPADEAPVPPSEPVSPKEAMAETPDLFTPPAVVPTSVPPTVIEYSASELVVEPGDTVIVRFDDNRIRRFRLSADTHRPEDGVVHINQPIGLALLGNGLEDEVEFVVDGKPRTVAIEKISKTSTESLS